MNLITAQITVGKGPYYRGGIYPQTYLYFDEKRPMAWFLRPTDFEYRGFNSDIKRVWISSRNDPIKDALLMIAVYELRIGWLRNMLQEHLDVPLSDEVHMYKDISKTYRELAYESLHEVEFKNKILIWISNGSKLNDHISILQEFDFETEILDSQNRVRVNIK